MLVIFQKLLILHVLRARKIKDQTSSFSSCSIDFITNYFIMLKRDV